MCHKSERSPCTDLAMSVPTLGVITAEFDWQNPESAAAAAWHLARLGSKDKRITELLCFLNEFEFRAKLLKQFEM